MVIELLKNCYKAVEAKIKQLRKAKQTLTIKLFEAIHLKKPLVEKLITIIFRELIHNIYIQRACIIIKLLGWKSK